MNPLQRFVKMLSEYIRTNYTSHRCRWIINGINNLLTAPDLFYHHKSFIDVHSQFAGLADMINVLLMHRLHYYLF